MGTKKVTVNLTEEQVDFLNDIASEKGYTFTDALRRAVNSERFFVEQEKAGYKILLEGKNQRLREVVRAH